MQNFDNSRPRNVTIACLLLAINYVMGLLRTMDAQVIHSFASLSPLAKGIFILFLLIMPFIIYMIWKGKNWARMILVILFLISLAGLQKNPPPTFSLATVVRITQVALQVVAIWLLFVGSGKVWFQKKTS